MPPRRSSARGSNAATAAHDDHPPPPITPNPRKRPAHVTTDEAGLFPTAEERKRRKKDVSADAPFPRTSAHAQSKKQAFVPQPIINSSDTPPEEDDLIDLHPHPPPPPSEKRIARRRESTRAIRERQVDESPSREVSQPKRQKTSRSEMGDMAESFASSSAAASSSRPRPSAPRPISPPRLAPRTPGGSTMPPPPPGTTFVRKTRKSMRGFGLMDEASTSADSVVPIPESETPMIKKNKELREAQQRRSSLGTRGQRASSSLGRGEISIPHSSVDDKLLYTHLGSQMPEPIRARHLIAWCAKRAVDAETSKKGKSKGKDRTDDGDRILNEIMDEFITGLGRGQVDTNVFADIPAASQGLLQSHPQNKANREVQAREEAIIGRCKDEDRQWAKIINRTNQKFHQAIDDTKAKRNKNAEPDLCEAGWLTDALRVADEIIAEGEGDLTKMGEFDDVEFKVDSLLGSTHVAVQYSRQAQRFLDGIFSSLAADLRGRERHGPDTVIPPGEGDGPDAVAMLAATAASSTAASAAPGPSSKKDPMLMLRALASADSKTQNDEAIAAAARITPVSTLAPVTSGSGLNVSVGPGVSATPRRIGAATPRRIGQGMASAQPTPRSIGVKEAE